MGGVGIIHTLYGSRTAIPTQCDVQYEECKTARVGARSGPFGSPSSYQQPTYIMLGPHAIVTRITCLVFGRYVVFLLEN